MHNPKTITVSDIMTKSVICIDSSMNINESAKMMEDAKVSALIVMENNSPVGIVTDRDFTAKVVAHAYPITSSVKTIMSSPLFSTNSDQPIRFASDLMYDKKIGKIPIIDDNNVIGIITKSDIVNLFATCTADDMRDMYFHSVVKIYEKYSPYN